MCCFDTCELSNRQSQFADGRCLSQGSPPRLHPTLVTGLVMFHGGCGDLECMHDALVTGTRLYELEEEDLKANRVPLHTDDVLESGSLLLTGVRVAESG